MTQPLAGKLILIVEDEAVFRSLLHSWLTSLGATTALAGMAWKRSRRWPSPNPT